MATVDSKVSLLRRVERYKKRLEAANNNRKAIIVAMQEEQKKLRAHYGSVVAEKLAAIRGLESQVSDLTTAAIQDRFKLQELENQVALQWRDNADQGEDLKRLTKRYNENVQSTRKLVDERATLRAQIESLNYQLDDAKQTIQYRLWVAAATQVKAIRQGIATRFTQLKSRLVNRWMIRRLSAPRVSALAEAGHIPENLVKMALKYYEADLERANGHVYTQVQTPSGSKTIVEKPSLLQRFRIFVGRA